MVRPENNTGAYGNRAKGNRLVRESDKMYFVPETN